MSKAEAEAEGRVCVCMCVCVESSEKFQVDLKVELDVWNEYMKVDGT